MEAQELESWRAQTQQREILKSKNDHIDVPPVEKPEPMAAELEALEAEKNEPPAEACAGDADVDTEQKRALRAPTSEVSPEEDETQLAAIRELMTRAGARGIWLTLAEIAEATEFGEASISAQLRHLRKAHHGGYDVEKRRRRSVGASKTMGKIGDARRGSLIWEYRVLRPA
jgi:hypothetical protein